MYARTTLQLTLVLACVVFPLQGRAQGTKQWTVSRYDEFQRGTTEGTAIRSDGRIETGLTTSVLYTASDTYVWSIAEGPGGLVYAGIGGSAGASAAVMRIPRSGPPEKIFAGKELAVQAIRVAPDGSILVATSPDGKVYRLEATGSHLEHVVFDPATTAERPKYLWDLAVAPDGTAYVATGAPAAVYRIPATQNSKPELLFQTADSHIRSLLLSPSGVLWAGSDGAGVIYRLETRRPGTKPFAAYAAGHREITALAMDTAGALYAAAVGAKGASSLPPLPVTGSVGVTVTFLQPGSTTAAGSNSVVPDGSEIDRIAPDGTPQRLLSLKDDVVYALMIHDGKLLAASGNRGRLYQIDRAVPGRVTEVGRTDAGQATTLAEGSAGLLAGTSNGGKVLRLREDVVRATYTSEVFDAGQYARWGRVEVQADNPGFRLFVRTGNVPAAPQGWGDWMAVPPSGEIAGIAAGRYAQWRAEFQRGGDIDSVTLNYLPRNVAPVVDDIVIATGARVPMNAVPQQSPVVQVIFPPATASAAQAISLLQQDTAAGPLTAQKDRSGIVIRWAAHDDNGDDLMFSVWYRGNGESEWRLLKDKISERFLSFDASLLPDGRYEARVVASDAPVHTDIDTLTGDRTSTTFVVDTTPPVPGPLVAHLEDGVVHWTFDAKDATSPITHAEISIDAGPWEYVEPIGGLSDSLTERYESRSALPKRVASDTAASTGTSSEHVVAVRVYDRAENMASVKVLVR